MSVILGNHYWIDYDESELECPICSFKFDASEEMENTDLPVFKMKCPGCKSDIGIKMPVFGGTTECFEWNTTPNTEQLKTKAPFKVNDI